MWIYLKLLLTQPRKLTHIFQSFKAEDNGCNKDISQNRKLFTVLLELAYSFVFLISSILHISLRPTSVSANERDYPQLPSGFIYQKFVCGACVHVDDIRACQRAVLTHVSTSNKLIHSRVATGQGKVREIQGQGKVREFCGGSGKFEILRKVRETQENPLKVREI